MPFQARVESMPFQPGAPGFRVRHLSRSPDADWLYEATFLTVTGMNLSLLLMSLSSLDRARSFLRNNQRAGFTRRVRIVQVVAAVIPVKGKIAY